jgi:hypothetical protein
MIYCSLLVLQHQCYSMLVSLCYAHSYLFCSLCDYSVAQVSGKSQGTRLAQSLSRYSENVCSRAHLHVLMSAFMKTAQFVSVSHHSPSLSPYFHLNLKLKLPELVTFSYISFYPSSHSRHNSIGSLEL